MDTILAFRTTNRGTWREMFAGMADFARTADWRLHPVDARSGHPDVRALAGFWRAGGAIIDESGRPGILGAGDLAGLPAVAIHPGQPFAGPSVRNDQAQIAKLAMGELLPLSPASLLFVGWLHERDWVAGRRAEAVRIAAMHGMEMRVFSPGTSDRFDEPAFLGRLADMVAALPKPCGVFAAADDIGAKVLAAAARIGLDVPGDVAVVSVDDDPEICENCTPTLTSVRPDYRRLGFEAAAALRALLSGDGTVRDVAVPLAGIVRRASTMPLRRPDHMVARALERIRLRACEGLTAAQVAEDFGTSFRTAEGRFRAATGKTIGETILERRFAAACAYLEQGRTQIGAIADFCGWNGAAAFRKAFRARFGMSPRDWAVSRRRPPEGNNPP